jgi:hypothetical protein
MKRATCCVLLYNGKVADFGSLCLVLLQKSIQVSSKKKKIQYAFFNSFFRCALPTVSQPHGQDMAIRILTISVRWVEILLAHM